MRAGVPDNFNKGKHLVRVMTVAVDAGKANAGGNGWQGSFFDLIADCLNVRLGLVSQVLRKFTELLWCLVLRLQGEFWCTYVLLNPDG